MASSDRSRSPRAERVLPGFPTWRGPMGSSIRAVPPRPEPQRPPLFRPTWSPMPGAYHMSGPYSRPLGASSPGVPAPHRSWLPTPPCPFPPTPCSPTQCIPPSQSFPVTQPIPPTQLLSPFTPHHPPSPPSGGPLGSTPSPCPSQRGSAPPSRPPTPASVSPTHDETRVYGFDANQFWQSDTTHHDCNKVNGLTLPRTIRSSAFTSKLDTEGCDPLALPLAALLYQQADNFWLRKLAHGRELYLIPTGDIATVVFGTELLSQLRNRGIDMDRISQCKARQDGQTLDKINNTKYAAKVVAEYIQQWAPLKATDPSSQHTITQLQQEVAELRQRLGDTSDPAPPESSAPPASTSASSANPPSTPIARALQGNAATPPPAFEPSSLLVAPVTTNAWLLDHPITSLAVRTFKQWLNDLDLNPSQRSTVERNLAKVEDWWGAQPDSAIDTVQRTALMMGLPVSILKGNFNDTNLVKVLTVAVTMSC
eukprot:s750_g6.t1